MTALDAPESRRSWWYRLGVVVAVVAAVGAVAFVVSRGGDGNGTSSSTTSSTTTSSAIASSTTEGSTTTTGAEQETSAAVWPFPGNDQPRFDDPVAVARSFAVDYLHFRAPILGAFQQGDNRSGEVPVRPKANGPVTTVLVRQLGSDDRWWVLGATNTDIEIANPTAGQQLSSPARVDGRALAFEGTVRVDVRADGSADPLGQGFVTGGGDELRPFHGSIPFETAPAAAGAIVFFTESAENGEVWQAAVVRVRLASSDTDTARCGGVDPARPQLRADEMEVKVYFSCVDDRSPSAEPGLVPVYRAVPKATTVLRSSLQALTAGPTAAERRRGISSFFGVATDDALRSVVLRDGHAVVDFDDLRPIIPNASSSAGSSMFLAELDATVFQFRSVRSVEYRLEGDCEAFDEWLQFGGCAPRTRPASQD